MHCTDPRHTKKARKVHRCDWCWEVIERGSSFWRWRWYDGADAATCKLHPECKVAMDELIEQEGGGNIEWMPGEHPRGCNCGDAQGCPRCGERKERASEPIQQAHLPVGDPL